MKVGIIVDVEPGIHGGVASAVKSLVTALGRLDGPEKYILIISSQAQADWLRPLAPNQEFAFHIRRRQNLVQRGARKILRVTLRMAGLTQDTGWIEVPLSDGFVESLDLDVVHFTTQAFTLCATPTVYNPHDLQHIHYPQFFTPRDLAWRDRIYRAACRLSHAIVVNSQWIKDDVIKQCNVPADRVQVIPEAAPTQFMQAISDSDRTTVRERYRLPEKFALYPNNTWPHKNHLRLLEALAWLRDNKGTIVPLVCTGARHNPSWPRLQARMEELKLTEQVKFLGFVPEKDLRALYQTARCVVVASLFEANSLPIFEAWAEGTPVVSSNVTALPEQVGEAGLLFDPNDPAAMGSAIERVFHDDALCADLAAKGRRRLADFDWARTAIGYRAVYRKVAGRRLSEEDQAVLAHDWMRNPSPQSQMSPR
ncbi:MAG TPA: glycosyltransferase family 1 protein [Hyphomonadaceae bacterium]|nr:glycosyltransferase family 1 protein [Hyphomonadaceae bacterium]